MKIVSSPSPNFGERKDGKVPRLLILHYTDTKDIAETFSYLLDPAKQVSAHYVVDEDGTVHALVDESKRAWHAGKSYWAGEEDVNSASIGIEVQNPGHQYGYRAFPEAQIAALAELCKGIVARHKISPFNVLGHSDICPGRIEKPDPGHLFPWERLAAEGVGIWLEVEGEAEINIAAALAACGYDPRVDLKMQCTAFQRHFEPEAFKSWDDVPEFGPKAKARLAALASLRRSAGLLRMKACDSLTDV